MINALNTIKTKQTTHASYNQKKVNKHNEQINHYRSFKSMIFMQDKNNLLASKWQKIEVYPFCD